MLRPMISRVIYLGVRQTFPNKVVALRGLMSEQKRLQTTQVRDTLYYNILLRELNDKRSRFDPQAILSQIEADNLKPDRVTYQRLIEHHCLWGDINQALSLLEKMKENGFPLSEWIFAALMNGYGVQGDIENMFEVFELMKAKNIRPTGITYSILLLKLGELINKNDQAISRLESIFEQISKEESLFSRRELMKLIIAYAKMPRDDLVTRIIDHLLKAYIKTGDERSHLVANLLKFVNVKFRDPNITKTIYDVCIRDCPPSPTDAAEVIRGYLSVGSFERALDFFIECGEHRITPLKITILKQCLMRRDRASLQKAFDVISNVEGQDSALFSLFSALVYTGNLDQAKKILDVTPHIYAMRHKLASRLRLKRSL